MSLLKCHNQWPRGIPSFVRRHEEPVEDVQYVTRSWRHFIREQWTQVDGTDVHQQGRALIERWANADQEFRDSYESQAPVGEPPFEDPDNEPCLSGDPCFQRDEVYVCISQWTPETQALLAKYNFKFRQSVARPNFQDMHMTQGGTVLFANIFPKLIIDDHTLQTGLALWIQYETNGLRERVYRMQLLSSEFPDLFRDVHLNQNPLEVQLNFMEDNDEEENMDKFWEEEPVDLRRPFTEVYIGANERTRALIDIYAPGYREAESLGNGLAIGYNLEQLVIQKGHPTTMRISEG